MKLVVVDVQNDFLPGGALPVPNGNDIIPEINSLVRAMKFSKIYTTQDWHKKTHISFAVNNGVYPYTHKNGQMKWPEHCIEYTHGARLAKQLKLGYGIIYLFKGTNPEEEEYSAADQILPGGDRDIIIVGLATDYCVKNTAIELKKTHRNVICYLRGCRGVAEETTKNAIEEMQTHGVEMWQ